MPWPSSNTLPLEQVHEICVVLGDGTGRLVEMVETPEEPRSTLANAGCFVLPASVIHACHLVEPSDRGEFERLYITKMRSTY